MSKFNSTVSTKTTNHVGAKAFKQNPELEIVSLLLTSFADESYYRSQEDTLQRLRQLISQCDSEFVAKCAVYARTKFGMRSITHVVASELAKHLSGKEWAKEFYNQIIYRPDDMMEILSYHTSVNGKETSAIKKGFAKAFGRFDKYSLAKYRGEGKEFKLVDVVNLVHPIPNDKNREAIDALVKGKLKSFDTWESELTKAGQVAISEDDKIDLKKDAWIKLIRDKKIKYFALLRNLRNILQQAPEVVEEACEYLLNRQMIKKSLVLPFRYLSAYNEIEKLKSESVFEKDKDKVKIILEAIEKAILISIDNMPTLTGRTLILSDNSGSMRSDGGGDSMVSRMSNTKTSDIANLFAVLYWTKCDNTLVGLFGDTLIHPKLDRSKGLFDNFKTIDREASRVGPGTETGIFDMFRKMIKDKIICDTMVVFSDCQIGEGCKWYSPTERANDFDVLLKEYKKINPNFRAYSVDLKGYGTTVFDGSVIKISGWSEKIFDIMKFAEIDKNALINEIKKLSFN